MPKIDVDTLCTEIASAEPSDIFSELSPGLQYIFLNVVLPMMDEQTVRFTSRDLDQVTNEDLEEAIQDYDTVYSGHSELLIMHDCVVKAPPVVLPVCFV